MIGPTKAVNKEILTFLQGTRLLISKLLSFFVIYAAIVKISSMVST